MTAPVGFPVRVDQRAVIGDWRMARQSIGISTAYLAYRGSREAQGKSQF